MTAPEEGGLNSRISCPRKFHILRTGILGFFAAFQIGANAKISGERGRWEGPVNIQDGKYSTALYATHPSDPCMGKGCQKTRRVGAKDWVPYKQDKQNKLWWRRRVPGLARHVPAGPSPPPRATRGLVPAALYLPLLPARTCPCRSQELRQRPAPALDPAGQRLLACLLWWDTGQPGVQGDTPRTREPPWEPHVGE